MSKHMVRYQIEGAVGESMTGQELLDVAEIAVAGGLIEVMPADADEAMDAFQEIGIPVVQVGSPT